MKISLDINKVAQEAKLELSPFLEKLDFRVFSKYNAGYLKYRKDPTTYFIDLEMNRFLFSVNHIYTNFLKETRILDIGVFIPVVPIMLSKLGYHVDIVEKLSLYENTLDPILNYVSKKYSIKLHNIDIIHGDTQSLNNKFEIVLLMAVLEHLNGSPKSLLEKSKNFLKPSGTILIDVPNIASLSKRLALLFKGQSPLPNYSDYFLSEYPFEGHNREYSHKELEYALTSTGYEIQKLGFINLSLPQDSKIQTRIIKYMAKLGLKSWGDIIWTVARPTII